MGPVVSRRDVACALVTGGSRGIGAAVARQLADAGWPVGVNYRRDSEAAARTVHEIVRAGGRAGAVAGDVTEPAGAEHLLGAAAASVGPGLCPGNNAGRR